ncbi:hypothetical protein Trydic_g9994, partial [Trypoxylus dichotomus]
NLLRQVILHDKDLKFSQPSEKITCHTTAPIQLQNQGFTQFGGQAQNSENIFRSNENITVFGQNTSITGQPQQQLLVWQPAPVMDPARSIMQPFSFGFNPQQGSFQANSISVPSTQFELDSILALGAKRRAECRESLFLLSKTYPFNSITFSNEVKHATSTSTVVTTATASTEMGAQIYLQPSKTVPSVTSLIKKISLFQLSERDTTFGETFDDGRSLDLRAALKQSIAHRRNRETLSGLDEHRPIKKPLIPPPKSSKAMPLKSLMLKRHLREDRSVLCDFSLPITPVEIQSDSFPKSQSTQCGVSENTPSSIENHDYCGITLNRWGYYTIPPLKEISKFKRQDGEVLVKGFTIGRVGYGSVYFFDRFDVANLNLDEIVHFRNREIIIYPKDTIKPPVGQGLNRRAQVTLESVYPMDKFNSTLIKDVATLRTMNFVNILREACPEHDSVFIDYSPETGSLVFMVEHFSKYS